MRSEAADGLFVDEPVSRDVLIDTIADFVKFETDGGRVLTEPAFEELSTEQKLLVAFLSEWTKKLVDVGDSEWLGPEYVSRIIETHIGVAYPVVRTLEQEGILENEDGQYRVRPNRFDEARRIIEGNA